MSSIVDVDMTTTALPTMATMSSPLATTGSICSNSSSTAATISNPYQELLERVIRRENTSVIRVVWYVIEQTKRGHKEVEASYSQLQTALNLSRCGVSMGVSRALEAGYITRTNNNNTGGAGSGKSSMSGNVRKGSAGGGGDHASARYVVNLPVAPVIPTDASICVQDTKSVKQTNNHNAANDKGSGAKDTNNNEGEQEGREERSVSQTAFNQTASAVLPYDSNIESLIELEVESDVPVDTAVGKPDSRRANTQPGAEAAADDDEDEGEGGDNEPNGGTTASIPTPSQPAQEQPHAQPQAEAEAGVRARSQYLANLSQDFSRELGDLAHGRSNVTQIHNLWRESGLSEKEFADLLYQSRDLTRRYAVLRPGETPPPAGKPRNRMAYFFTVVRNMLGLRPAAATATLAVAPAATSAPASVPASSHARPNSRYGYGSRVSEYKQAQALAQGNNLSKTEGSMVSPPQTQLAYPQRRQAPVLSSATSGSALASTSNSSSDWSRSSGKNKAKAEKMHGKAQVKTQAVAPNGVKLLHASWLQFIR
jgi:hypothetical protein